MSRSLLTSTLLSLPRYPLRPASVLWHHAPALPEPLAELRGQLLEHPGELPCGAASRPARPASGPRNWPTSCARSGLPRRKLGQRPAPRRIENLPLDDPGPEGAAHATITSATGRPWIVSIMPTR